MLTRLRRRLCSGTPRQSFMPRLEALEGRDLPSTLTVTNLKDTGVAGDGSLRGEIAAAASGDTVVFAPGVRGTVALGSTLVLGTNVTILGPTGVNHNPLVTLSGHNAVADLVVNPGVTASITGLTIADGYVESNSGLGGAGIVNHGTLALDGILVRNNNAIDQASDLQCGGGICNDGTLTVRDSTIADNTVGRPQVYGPGDAGFISGYGGGIYNAGTLTVRNSVVSGNTAGGFGVGGGIVNGWQATTLIVSDSTISGNTADRGGGIEIGSESRTRTGLHTKVVISNSVVSGNTAVDWDGGGIAVAGSAPDLDSTIVAGNVAVYSTDVSGPVGGTNNVIGDGDGLIGISDGNLYGNRVGGADRDVVLVVSGFPTAANAGAAGTFTVTAQNLDGTTAADYTGTIHFTSSDPAAVLPADYTFKAADGGTHSFRATLTTAGLQSITADDTANYSDIGTATGLLVSPTAASTFLISAPASVRAGTAFSLTVTVTDANGNTITGYTGSAHFTSSDALAALPADYTFTAADQGSHTFRATLGTVGTQSITAADAASGVSGRATGIAVSPAAVGLAAPAGATAGTAFGFTVTALNDDGSPAKGYAGTVRLISTDPTTAFADAATGNTLVGIVYTFVAGDRGTHTFPVTLDTAGSQSLTASDTTSGVSGSASAIAVTPAAASQAVFTQGPTPGTEGRALTAVQATIEDRFGNVIGGYAGTVTVGVKSGPGGFAAGSTTTAAVRNGVATFGNLVLNTAGNYTLSASSTGLAAATSRPIGISPAAFQLAAPAGATAGTSFRVTVTALNADGTPAIAYTGTVHFTSSVSKAMLPADYSFTAGDRGAPTFPVTLETAGSQSLTASDTTSGVSGSASAIAVTPAAASQVVLTQGPASGPAGKALSPVQATIEDQFGNVISGSVGIVTVGVQSGPGGFAAGSTTTAAVRNGVATFSNLVLDTAGRYTLSATSPGLAGATSNPFAIGPAAASRLVFTQVPSDGSVGQVLGLVKVAIEDSFGNVVPVLARSTMMVSVQSGPGGFATGSVLVALPRGGVGTFGYLTLARAGTYTFKATFGALSGISPSVTVSPIDVSASVKVALASNVSNSSGVYTPSMASTSTSGGTLSGPLALVLTGLPGGVTLLNGSGTTGGNPYVDFLPAGQTFAPGLKATLSLKFSAKSLKSITYRTQVLQGI